ncbi:hypothetical protein HF888_05310 [Bermanella marisrubri]|uniref:Lipoprotein n=1 Tax=Bermanella marisrubri TaxID=207949 RepID=Q1N1S7_9GAMM|nr:hypothetical protein [Bermanella marisrubri]EAT12204.1 hypothetical protein RED65_04240 [Oceanobacter sp. RED65] [Bermanella marisrubri]QIZ83675.1 hypothetical protein HF888_05310 [Bermanella marisrubri]
MQYLVVLMTFLFLVACGALDDSDDGSSTGTTDLDGLWIGTTSEYVGSTTTATEFDTIVLFNNQNVYLLRTDEAQIGSYEITSNGASDWDLELFPYANPDVDNNFFVGTRNADRFQVDGLFASDTRLVLNYDNTNRRGTAILDLDTAQANDLNVKRVQGEWSTTDSIMYINQEGGFIGNIQGCQWEGSLSENTGSTLNVSIVRRNCSEFNPVVSRPSQGFAVLDGTGSLHFMAEQDNSFLWMKFTPSTAAPTPDTGDGAADDGGDDGGDEAADPAA